MKCQNINNNQHILFLWLLALQAYVLNLFPLISQVCKSGVFQKGISKWKLYSFPLHYAIFHCNSYLSKKLNLCLSGYVPTERETHTECRNSSDALQGTIYLSLLLLDFGSERMNPMKGLTEFSHLFNFSLSHHWILELWKQLLYDLFLITVKTGHKDSCMMCQP